MEQGHNGKDAGVGNLCRLWVHSSVERAGQGGRE
jgi:hypothetical protein